STDRQSIGRHGARHLCENRRGRAAGSTTLQDRGPESRGCARLHQRDEARTGPRRAAGARHGRRRQRPADARRIGFVGGDPGRVHADPDPDEGRTRRSRLCHQDPRGQREWRPQDRHARGRGVRSGWSGQMNAVAVEGLTKRFAGSVALDRVSFTVAPGELFGFIGPDGAGKTTLFRILVTLLEPDAGHASVLGRDVVKEFRALRARVGYMPGRFSLYPDLSVEENLRFFASVFGTTIDAERA